MQFSRGHYEKHFYEIIGKMTAGGGRLIQTHFYEIILNFGLVVQEILSC